MKMTAKEMYECAKANGYVTCNKKKSIKCFSVIERSLQPDENVQVAFVGLLKHMNAANLVHSGNCAFAITNKRIIIAEKSIINELLQTISLDNINDISYSGGISLGTITIDTLKEKFGVMLHKNVAVNLNAEITEILQQHMQDNGYYDKRTFNSEADELIKFKQLLDAGAISQAEYDQKKAEIFSK